jgi:hypothetical protein
MKKTDELKKAFFQNQDGIFGRKSKMHFNSSTKDITAIFGKIASHPQYKEIRKRYKVDKIISKILLPKQLHYVLYSFYRNGKLTIATQNHIGQAELNMQKMILIKFLKQIKDYEDIKEVSIFRDEKFIPTKEDKKLDIKEVTFREKSYGTFENNISDKKLYKKIEEIRELIKNKSV